MVAKLLIHLKSINAWYKNIGADLNKILIQLKSFHDLDEENKFQLNYSRIFTKPSK